MRLADLLNTNTKQFTALVEGVPDELFNVKPDQDSWSVGENVEHIVRSEFGTARLFNGETKARPDRDSEKFIEEITQSFLDRSSKYRSFGVVNPTEGEKNKEELLNKFRSSRKEVAGLIQQQDADELCVKYEHPVYGFLTRREWIHFNVAHAQRHMMQIEEVLKQIMK